MNVSLNVVDQPMLVLASQNGYSANYEKLAKAQSSAYKDDRISILDKIKKNVEINPYHPFIKELLDKVKDQKIDDEVKNTAQILYEVSLMNSGYTLKDSSQFAKRVYGVVGDSLGLNRNLNEVEIDLSEVGNENMGLDGIGADDLNLEEAANKEETSSQDTKDTQTIEDIDVEDL